MAAGAVALSVQVLAFGAGALPGPGSAGSWRCGRGARWSGWLVIAACGSPSGGEAAGTIPTLFALAGFFFGLLLLEPVYFRPGRAKRPRTGR